VGHTYSHTKMKLQTEDDADFPEDDAINDLGWFPQAEGDESESESPPDDQLSVDNTSTHSSSSSLEEHVHRS